jgi:hypothetical protein
LQRPALGGGLNWNTSALYTAGVISVVAPGIPGDYNNNGVVDSADYVVWRKHNNTATTLPNDSTPGTDQSDYNVWRAHFGQTIGSGAGATAGLPRSAIPEPCTLLMLLTAAIFGMAQSARRPQLDIFKERYDVAVKP